jgi:hypothetical protein
MARSAYLPAGVSTGIAGKSFFSNGLFNEFGGAFHQVGTGKHDCPYNEWADMPVAYLLCGKAEFCTGQFVENIFLPLTGKRRRKYPVLH